MLDNLQPSFAKGSVTAYCSCLEVEEEELLYQHVQFELPVPVNKKNVSTFASLSVQPTL
jgi:hypothetical protein